MAQQRSEELGRVELDAGLFLDGALLPKLAKDHAAEFDELLFKKLPRTCGGKRTWGSLCSGSEGAHFVMKAIQEAWPDVELQQRFACESSPAKRAWIHDIVNSERAASGQDLVCVFTDIADMKKEFAHCTVHDRACPVPGCELLIVGTSCKDLSKMNRTVQKKPGKPILSMATSPGGSAGTFRGLLGFLDNHHVDVVVYENSDMLDDKDGACGGNEEYDVFHAEMSARKYEGQNMVLDSSLFGSAASRRRFWCVLSKAGVSSTLDFTGLSYTYESPLPQSRIASLLRVILILTSSC